MTFRQLEQIMRGKIHHLATVTTNDGKTLKGHLQPYDHSSNPTLYLTPADGSDQTHTVQLSDVQSIQVED